MLKSLFDWLWLPKPASPRPSASSTVTYFEVTVQHTTFLPQTYKKESSAKVGIGEFTDKSFELLFIWQLLFLEISRRYI